MNANAYISLYNTEWELYQITLKFVMETQKNKRTFTKLPTTKFQLQQHTLK